MRDPARLGRAAAQLTLLASALALGLSACGSPDGSALTGPATPAPGTPQAPVTPAPSPRGSAVATAPAPSATTPPVTRPPATRPPVTSPPASIPPPAAPTSPTALATATFGDWTGTRPATIGFSGDGGNVVTGIRWTSWTSTGASGTGTWGYNACVPNCATGHVVDYPVTLTLGAPVDGRFTQLTEVQSGPYGRTYVFRLPLPAATAS